MNHINTVATREAPQVFFTAVDSWKSANGLTPPDITCVATEGFIHAAKIDWRNCDLELVEVGAEADSWNFVAQMEESTWYSIVRLPAAISSPAWCEFHAIWQPKISAICDQIVLEFFDASTKQRAIFTETVAPLKAEVLEALQQFDGGRNLETRATTAAFLNDRLHADFPACRVDIDDVGVIGPEPDWAELHGFADKTRKLAEQEGVALCDEPFNFFKDLVVLVESHYFDPEQLESCPPARRMPKDEQDAVAASLASHYRAKSRVDQQTLHAVPSLTTANSSPSSPNV